MAQKLQDIEKRLSLYKKGNHIPRVEIKKYSFDEIQREFDMKKNIDYLNTKVIIKYYDHIPQISDCAILNCANSDAVNARYRIDHRVTQEGQLFHDSDVFASNLNEFYPFNFKNELLYATNVTFHNNASLQWDPFSLRTNDITFAASIKNTYETEQLKPDLERIIGSIFKVDFINNRNHLYLWPIGCGVFKNNQRIIAELFAKAIKDHIGYLKEIVMVIYDRKGADKRFNDCFISELNTNQLCYRIN